MSRSSPNLTRRCLLAMTGATLICAPAVLHGAPAVQHINGAAFGSTWRVTLPDLTGTETLRPALAKLLADIDRLMSPWRGDSEISAFNRASGPTALSGETTRVVAAALDIAQASDGWFDPTVGPQVRKLGFGPIEGANGRWTGLHMQDNHLSKDDARLTMDPCGIAKGHALDLMRDALIAAGCRHFLIDLGGELAAYGHHPSGRGWQIAIEDPRPDVVSGSAVMQLGDLAVATSGNRAQGFDHGGHRQGHIIDPHRARPALGTLASVSVLSDSAMIADGWATALMAAGDTGPDLARRKGISALFLFAKADGLRRVMTADFDRHML
ncbi:FAD:protein FMN transferase [Oceaniovalibus sp. ACAM 378]|uniref:FAD:protein FMN transferase n=1 Tax=Oceaniovalibus sp. ACAM 378 TaxID=2599923 RepID=UPI0011DB936F|nr:FAD:protein FMN transferase [Oceaniovalibus sp. ACAM 378]TYB84746.1 FAD:protein FMN transferase [Oceaniovalibus sp. ACAM 378]